MLGTISAVHAHTKHFYCALSKKLSKISEPMITATQIVWKYFRWIRSQLQPFLLVMTAIYYFYCSDQTKTRDWKGVFQNLCISQWNENKRTQALKFSFPNSIRNKNKLLERKALIDYALVPIWKMNFCSWVLRLSELPKCRERPQTVICCLKWLGRLKCGMYISVTWTW